MDEFEQDPFVVGNSVVEYESSLDELDMVDEFGSDDYIVQRKRFEPNKFSAFNLIFVAMNCLIRKPPDRT